MNELHLFAGAGGGCLASRMLGHRIVGYVENDNYCQRVLSARIEDGHLDEAPIFGDIRAFLSEGYAASYKGMVDVVAGGFPCQPFSHAGARQGEQDERNMWGATMDVVRAVQPAYCYFENVPGLLSARVDDGTTRPVYYYGNILRDLAESGYRVGWRVLSSAEVGAPHKRDRLWLCAHRRP